MADHGKSNPMLGVSQRSKNHGAGYPIDIDTIDHAGPMMGVTDRGKSNAHGHDYDAHGNTGMDPMDKDRRGGGPGSKHSGAAGKNSKTSLKGMAPVNKDRRG